MLEPGLMKVEFHKRHVRKTYRRGKGRYESVATQNGVVLAVGVGISDLWADLELSKALVAKYQITADGALVLRKTEKEAA